MKIAIPLANGRFSMHFGHCDSYAMFDVDPTEKTVLQREDIDAPAHVPGKLPPWLASHGTDLVIAGGMGQRALQLFAQDGIRVVLGASGASPEELVGDYLAGTLQTSANVCDH
jgi:predicted Fe-Mo cluster-binding NifX family protein